MYNIAKRIARVYGERDGIQATCEEMSACAPCAVCARGRWRKREIYYHSVLDTRYN